METDTITHTHRQHAQRGSAALMAILGLMLLGGMGATAVQMVSSDEEGRALSHQGEQAAAEAQAGVEFAKYQLNIGNNPVGNWPMGPGSYSVATAPSAGTVIATGQVGGSKKSYQITAQFGKDCVDIDTTTAHSAADNITGLKLVRNCLAAATITQWQVTWAPNTGEKMIKVQVQGSPLVTLIDQPAGIASGTTVDAVDYVMSKGIGVPEPINKLQFNQNLTQGKTYTITLYLADGSTVTRSFIDPINGGGAPPPPAAPTGFTVSNGVLSVNSNKTVQVNSLCAQITYGANGPQVPVKAWSSKGNAAYQALFGGANVNLNGGQSTNLASGNNGDTFKFEGNAKYVRNGQTLYNATYDSTQTDQVYTLVNGDTPPLLAGFGGQAPVSQCIAGYLNGQTGKVTLSANQAILLFELGTNMAQHPGSPAADFQDLALLVTVQ